MNTILPNRPEAGRRLAEKLSAYRNHSEAIVLGLPRGGVPVAFEIAKVLNLPLDVCLIGPLHHPSHPEIVIGAVAENALVPNYSGNIHIINEDKSQTKNLDPQLIKDIAAREKAELVWRDRCYRSFRPLKPIRNQITILVDDGITTGSTIAAAIAVLRRQQPRRIVVAVPVLSLSILRQLNAQLDRVVYLIAPITCNSVDCWYEDPTPTTDQTVCDLLSQATTKKLALC